MQLSRSQIVSKRKEIEEISFETLSLVSWQHRWSVICSVAKFEGKDSLNENVKE